MNNRYLGALFLSPLIIFLFFGGIYLKYCILVLSLLGMYEFYKIITNKNIHPFSIFGYILCLIYYFNLNKDISFEITFFFLVTFMFIMLCIAIIYRKYNFIDISITIFVFLYVAILFSFIVLTENKLYGNYLVWLIFISSWVCDTAAYYSGKYFGKRKLCPQISPKKTIEGSIGGLLGSALGCGIFGVFSISKGVNIQLHNFFIIGIFSGMFCQFGDLVASSIKRYVGVKDFSNLIPGHGGILDRFDSILFASFVVYYYIAFILRL